MVELISKDAKLSDFVVSKELRHSLLTPRLGSRLATAMIFGYQGRKKAVIKLLLLINNASRAFIITQEGLQGFLMEGHNSAQSFCQQLLTSAAFRTETACSLQPTQIKEMIRELKSHTDASS